jgi:membrane-bound lytic murein transglycosylase A
MRTGIVKFIGLLALLALPFVAALLLLTGRPPQGLTFRAVPFESLPGWHEDALIEALPALQKSCDRVLTFPRDRRIPGAAIGGRMKDWEAACQDVLLASSGEELRAVLAKHFTALEVSAGGNPQGVFTGYYETLLKGSLQPSARFHVPLYLRPPELVMVDLGAFRPDLKGRRIAGEVRDGRLVPFHDREEIVGGALDGRDLELLWVDDPVDAFFLHIQGSGRVEMPDGSIRRVGYAAQNGHPYLAVGRVLIANGEIPREKISMQSIRRWLADNPDRMDGLMNENASYIFFRDLGDGDGPFGSAAVPLTPRRSLAVDRRHLPLHAPVWLSATHPHPRSALLEPVPFNRLMVAQVTGGAINGEIRGDVFWGFGDEAEEIAGRMANQGRYWLLLPTPLARAAEAGGDG